MFAFLHGLLFGGAKAAVAAEDLVKSTQAQEAAKARGDVTFLYQGRHYLVSDPSRQVIYSTIMPSENWLHSGEQCLRDAKTWKIIANLAKLKEEAEIERRCCEAEGYNWTTFQLERIWPIYIKGTRPTFLKYRYADVATYRATGKIKAYSVIWRYGKSYYIDEDGMIVRKTDNQYWRDLHYGKPGMTRYWVNKSNYSVDHTISITRLKNQPLSPDEVPDGYTIDHIVDYGKYANDVTYYYKKTIDPRSEEFKRIYGNDSLYRNERQTTKTMETIRYEIAPHAPGFAEWKEKWFDKPPEENDYCTLGLDSYGRIRLTADEHKKYKEDRAKFGFKHYTFVFWGRELTIDELNEDQEIIWSYYNGTPNEQQRKVLFNLGVFGSEGYHGKDGHIDWQGSGARTDEYGRIIEKPTIYGKTVSTLPSDSWDWKCMDHVYRETIIDDPVCVDLTKQMER